MPCSRSALNPRGAPAARASRQAPEGTGARTDAHAAQRIHRGTPATVGPGRGALIRVMAGAPVFMVDTSFVVVGESWTRPRPASSPGDFFFQAEDGIRGA